MIGSKWQLFRSTWSYISFKSLWGLKDAKAKGSGQKPINVKVEDQKSGHQRSKGQRIQI